MIIPAVLGETYAEVEREIKLLEGHTDWLHLDVTDGHFTSVVSWGNLEDLKFLDGKTKIEAHLMVEEPELVIKDWMEVADRIIVHTEATDNLEEIIDVFSLSRIKFGVALLLPTPVETLAPYLPKLNLVQLMSIGEIGAQGHGFDDRVLEKVKTLRALAPDVIIQLDGGINRETAPLALAAGVENLVIGSAIWRTPDPIASLQNFQTLLEART